MRPIQQGNSSGLSVKSSASPRDSYSGKMPPISAPAWITATFEEKRRISRGGAESWGKEVPGKNRPLIPFGATTLKEWPHRIINNLRASASLRDSYSGQMPPISAPAWITAIFEEKRKNLTRRRGERGELGKGSPGKKSTANLLWGDHIATTSSPPRLRVSASPRLRVIPIPGRCHPSGRLRGSRLPSRRKTNLTRRRGERGELGKGSPGKKSTANLLWGDHSQGRAPPHH